MKLPHYTKQDITIQWIVLPVFILIENSLLLGSQYWHSRHIFLATSIIMLLFMYPHWYVNNLITLQSHRIFPNNRQFIQRFIPNLLLLALNSSLFTTVAWWCFGQVGLPNYQPQLERLGYGLLFVVLTVLIVSFTYESINAFEEWEKTIIETEQLKKANLQRKFESLKSQINPHFLFNSLNTLSSLVEEDAEKAELFVEEMSSVYRYLLRSNEAQLVPLSAEMQFARSYFHLLRTRYGDNIRLEHTVDSRFDGHLLPPLTLQLLLENAVKHNSILPEQPLHICIETHPDARLVIRNNIQRRSGRVVSHQVGLSNIATQYRLLGEGDINVQDDDRFFTVTLPLIRQG
ncbi:MULTISPECIES: sensor histidine kinase [unclassified Spirosoma]|uniref:sensor histidine kinase n=1 Tax=unclassified Spirosoma TaxID=2621999 RepID=UPI00096284D4|nr:MULTISPECIES: sensor histidine kinase [unclassified Spirosoma]MBN8822812.1 histidine kinase [Spirosoma sp.]OJW80013.1 MAG: hypothetical protein BGO59_02035 [Spirosoma sp. 48-14]